MENDVFYFLEVTTLFISTTVIPIFSAHLIYKRLKFGKAVISIPIYNRRLLKVLPYAVAIIILVTIIQMGMNGTNLSVTLLRSVHFFSFVLLSVATSFYLKHVITETHLIINDSSHVTFLPWSKIHDYSMHILKTRVVYNFFYYMRDDKSIKVHQIKLTVSKQLQPSINHFLKSCLEDRILNLGNPQRQSPLGNKTDWDHLFNK